MLWEEEDLFGIGIKSKFVVLFSGSQCRLIRVMVCPASHELFVFPFNNEVQADHKTLTGILKSLIENFKSLILIWNATITIDIRPQIRPQIQS
jgi:hypothetical protein